MAIGSIFGLAGTVAGMFYARARYRRGRAEEAIIAHRITNAPIAADVLILGIGGCGDEGAEGQRSEEQRTGRF